MGDVVLGEIARNASDRSGQGLAYLLDFAVTTVTPALLAIPVLALGFGRLSGTGARALALGVEVNDIGYIVVDTEQKTKPRTKIARPIV